MRDVSKSQNRWFNWLTILILGDDNRRREVGTAFARQICGIASCTDRLCSHADQSWRCHRPACSPWAFFVPLFKKISRLNWGGRYWVRFWGLRALVPVRKVNWRGRGILGNPFPSFYATFTLLNKPEIRDCIVFWSTKCISLSLSHKKLCVLGF